MLDKLAAVEARYSQIEARLAAPETYDDPAQVARLNKEQNELSPVVETYRAYLRAREREQEAGALLSDPELRELAQEEQQQARQELERLERELQLLLLPLLAPVLWTLALSNHASDHTYFTYRNLCGAFFALFALPALLAPDRTPSP